MNPHSDLFDKRIRSILKNKKYLSNVIGRHGTDEDYTEFIRTYSDNVFTNEVHGIISPQKLKLHTCSDCGKCPAQERCHGIGDERPILIMRALRNVWSDTVFPISMEEILVEFFELHKTTKFCFKCKACHLNERRLTGTPSES